MSLSVCLLLVALVSADAMQIGVISYWGTNSALYAKLPAGSLALVNPDNGIFVSSGQTQKLVPDLSAYQSIVKQTSSRKISMLGYVPTGYFNHGCNADGKCQKWDRIEAQVKAYFANMPDLKGIFFDEAAPSNWNCGAFVGEYQKLRDIVKKYNAKALIAFNAGVPDNCAVSGAKSGEILVLFESDETAYFGTDAIKESTATALRKGVVPWHLVHTVKTEAKLNAVFKQAQSTNVAYLYVTDIGGDWQHGEDTWGSLPSYWSKEVALFQ